MGLRLDDRWVWDFWLAQAGETYHGFFLQAPRSLGDPDLRHVNASVGHAVSRDLVEWTVVGDALGPGPPGSWDDLATWTGSIIQKDGVWYMFYTGATREDTMVVQRVGAAVSSDLVTWEKLPGPLFGADPRWYETVDQRLWFEEAWRDPWVFAGEDGTYHALVTARVNDGPPDGRGVIGHAVSTDLERWEVRPPLCAGGEFGHLEVMQLSRVDGEYVLAFSCDAQRVSSARRLRLGLEPEDAVYVLRAPTDLGPFDLRAARPALPSHLYSGRLVQRSDDVWVWLAFVLRDDAGRFIGELCDPIPFSSGAAGLRR